MKNLNAFIHIFRKHILDDFVDSTTSAIPSLAFCPLAGIYGSDFPQVEISCPVKNVIIVDSNESSVLFTSLEHT